DDKLINLFSHPRINPYIHLSIQSASSSVLKDMNRHYDGTKVREVLQKLRNLKRKDGAILNIGADIIVGFPGESDEDYGESLDIVKTFQISSLHAFPFSPHIDHYNVPAGKFKNQVPNHISQRRVKEIIAAGEQAKENLYKQSIGQKLVVLIEKVRGDTFSGWTQNYIAANKKNFLPDDGQEIKRGKCVSGVLR
ncbi:radical SAM protein, partial [Candidatus Gracilibacteria bacterium]|nr:radical SAM protein [Candidatus Gracilibacteria bacterium]